MNIVIFDTETTSLTKPFCYNIGYVIANEKGETLLEKSFVVEQIWHNLALFSTSYYAEKRPLYVSEMKAKKTVMKKFGYVCQEMIRDFKAYNIEYGFAYNSSFDEKVFDFCGDWFKCSNPFDTIKVKDIRGYVHNFIVNENYKKFCEENNYLTDSGNYSTTAETVYRYITNNTDFIEDHTALSDSKIEKDILFYCLKCGALLTANYSTYKSIERKVEKVLELTDKNKNIHTFEFTKIRINSEKTKIKLN